MTEPDISATSAGANDELWLTYLNYDRAVQQAVNRLGALSSNNVEEFRVLLLKGRDRTRIKEYEAESIRRLQGEAFVGDDELQRALIVLNAEDPCLGDALKRIVSTTGRPGDLDQTVAAIRSGQVTPPEQTAEPIPDQTKVHTLPRRPQAASPPESVHQPSDQEKIDEPPRGPLAVSALSELREPQPIPRTSGIKRLAMFGALFIVAAVGLVFVWSRFATDDASKVSNVQTMTPPLRPATEDQRTASAPPKQVAQPPSAETPAQNANSSSDQAASPATSPAASSAEPTSPEKDASPPSDASPTATPVPGARYKVVRGDMLSEIAQRAYKDASKFTLIQRANPSLRNGSDRIYYDQVIYIPPEP